MSGSRVWLAALRRLARRRSVSVGYHGVDTVRPDDDPENHCIPPDRFRLHLGLLIDAGFELVTLGELADQAADGPPPPGLAAVSFDDGMENNRRVVLPILREAGARATVFVTTGMIGKPNPWMGDGSRMMDERELAELAAAGVELGAHTVTHPDMSLLGEEDCYREIAESRAALETISGRAVRTFAYPFCRYGDAAIAAVRRAGLTAAVTCEGRGDWSPHRMKRALITARDGMPSFVAKLADMYQPAFDSRAGRVARDATRGARSRARRIRMAR
jgi:peptidoglycan/xylan/chitin deacetylase (PgdA/CDA1 family)